MNCLDWFSNFKSTLYYWNKPHLVMMYYPFCILLDSIISRLILESSLWKSF